MLKKLLMACSLVLVCSNIYSMAESKKKISNQVAQALVQQAVNGALGEYEVLASDGKTNEQIKFEGVVDLNDKKNKNIDYIRITAYNTSSAYEAPCIVQTFLHKKRSLFKKENDWEMSQEKIQ